MKKSIIIIIFGVISAICNTYAQTYISGDNVIPYNNIASSTYLTKANRISHAEALSLANTFKQYPDQVVIRSHRMGGEYFLHEGMVINVFVTNRRPDFDLKPFSAFRDLSRDMVSGGEKRRLEEYYIDSIKYYTGFGAYYNYFKKSNKKYFHIQDNLNRYVIMGTIYNSMDDVVKAEAFVGTLLNSITFK